jgi:hypothetical protein
MKVSHLRRTAGTCPRHCPGSPAGPRREPDLADLCATRRQSRIAASQPQIFGRWVLLVRRCMLCPSRWVIPGLAAGVTGWPTGSRRQPVLGSRAGARADVRAPGPGCRRDGWPGCCGQHKSNTSSGPGGVQHASNTELSVPSGRSVPVRSACQDRRKRAPRRWASGSLTSGSGIPHRPRQGWAGGSFGRSRTPLTAICWVRGARSRPMAVTWRDRCGVAVGHDDRPCRCVCSI